MENEKKLGQESAFPYTYEWIDEIGKPNVNIYTGISKRLLLAGMAMQGLLSNSQITKRFELIGSDINVEALSIANASLMCADELLRQEKL